VPLVLLYELSILLARVFGRTAQPDADAEPPEPPDRLASAEGS
jgi:Sec-independent protein secretion pathway component TatC